MNKRCKQDHKHDEKIEDKSEASGREKAPKSDSFTLAFKIQGMDCAEEIQILKREVGSIVGGVQNLAFDLLNAKMMVQADTKVTAQIVASVAKAGMTATVWEDSREKEKPKTFWRKNSRNVLTSLSGGFVLAGFISDLYIFGFRSAAGLNELAEGHQSSLLAHVCYALAIASGICFVIPKAFYAARKFRPDMNLLMVVAILGALFIGEWFEGATVAFLFSLSLTLESWSVGRARKAVASLLELAPPVVRVPDESGDEKLLPPESIAVGTIFLVKPGDRFPLDGKVFDGESEANQAPITGESVPVHKKKGDDVFAGTINGDGSLYIESTKPAGETLLSNIIRMVGEAQSKRAPSEQFVEKFALIYTPIILALALAVLFIPPLFFGGNWNEWVYKALTLLVIACPCALVISTPVSVVAALTAAARNGVLIKGGAYIEAPAKLRAIAVDKTGTLTQGKPVVVEVAALDGTSRDELLRIAVALEVGSTHPLAQALITYGKENKIDIKAATEYQIVQGKGAQGKVNGEKYWLGSHRYLKDSKLETSELHKILEAKEDRGQTVVVVGSESKVMGYVVLSDAVRPEAKAAVVKLHEVGISAVVMLTGDNRQTASVVANMTGIDQFSAELLPQDKVREIEKLVEKYKYVAMVGDGINDAPAMGCASLAIAMGAIGSDVAIETADIALMSDDLSKIGWLVAHSRKTLAIIRQNIVFSLSIKAIFGVLTFSGFASLWGAIAADTGASLLVVFNALRLLKVEN
jgi:Cd2+/Zn2+-exporting ATPase